MRDTVDRSSPPVAHEIPRRSPTRSRRRLVGAAIGSLVLIVAPFVVVSAPASATTVVSGWVEPLAASYSVVTTWQEPGCTPSDPYFSAGRSVYSTGVDLSSTAGTPVRSIGVGVVVANQADPAWGTTAGATNSGLLVRYTADDGTSFTALYGDAQVTPGTTVGDSVNAGQQIATVGSSSFLHLAIHPGGAVPGGDWTAGQCPIGSDDDGFVDPQTFLATHVPTPGTIADGTFVSHGGDSYRIAGGAPLFVSSWSGFGGTQPTTALTDTQWSRLALVPADGTVIQGAQRGEIYRIAGGAPIAVGGWDGFGGSRPTIVVDDADLDHAGQTGNWAHLRALPRDGTFISGVQRGEAYRVAGGAPIYVSTWAAFGGVQRPCRSTTPRSTTPANQGSGATSRAVPANGTLIRGSTTRTILEIASGHVTPTEAQGPATIIDQAAITNAGSGGVWNHLLAVPTWPSTPTPTPTPTSTPSPSAGVGSAPANPPAVDSAPSPVPPPPIRLDIRWNGHAVGHGWLCLAKTRHAVVRHHTTSVGGCVAVAHRGRTVITPRVKGRYYLILIGHHRHVSPHRYAFTSPTAHAARWVL